MHQSTWDNEFLCTAISLKDGQVLIGSLLQKNQKYEYGGQLKVKIHVLFYGDNS
jgi:hypothetical protein